MMKNILESEGCPKCNKQYDKNERVPNNRSAYSYEDCYRRCDTCGVAISNSKDNPVIIYRDYTENVPVEIRDGIDSVIDCSISQLNLKNKKKKFGFSNSEDALTWTFFKYFVKEKRFSDLLKLLKIEDNFSEMYIPEIYLWGVNISNNEKDFLDELKKISIELNEDPRGRTEPDVIIKLNNKVVFIEVKYKSANDYEKNSAKFTRYKTQSVDMEKVTESGHYELLRNLAYVSRLSTNNDFQLINLGPEKLFGDKKNKLKLFVESIGNYKENFKTIAWEDVIPCISNGDYDNWFSSYLKNKFN